MNKKTIRCRLLALLLLAVLALSLLPLLLIARHDYPCSDDYSYSTQTHRAFAETGAPLAALSAAAGTAKSVYTGWQGSFSAVFLMALQPGVFHPQLYALTPVLMLAALLGATFFFFLTVLPRIFSVRRDVAAAAAALACLLCTQLLPSPVQGLFWYNGAVYYTFFHALALAALALGVRLVTDGGRVRAAGLTLLAFFLGGGNYVTALACCLAAASAVALLALLRDGRWRRLVLPLLALLAALALSAAAPGNAVRQAAYPDTPNALRAVFLALKAGARSCAYFFSLPLLGTLAFLAPLFYRAAAASPFRFRFPALVSLYSYGLFSAMFCPPLYAMNNTGDLRLINILYFSYVLLCLLNLLYWLGWLAARRGAKGGDSAHASLPLTAALSVLLALCCLFSARAGQCFSSVSALSSLRTGEAEAYGACMRARHALLADARVTDAVLPALPCRPYVLYFDDVTADRADWRNTACAAYYGKASVVADSAAPQGQTAP